MNLLARVLILVAACTAGCASAQSGDGFFSDAATRGQKDAATVDARADRSAHEKDGGAIHLAREAGVDGATPCTGLACAVQSCGVGGSTVVQGTVYAPNGTL